MEAVKNIVAVLAGIVGFLTALLTLYAKFIDLKKAAASADDADTATMEPLPQKPSRFTIEEEEEPAASDARPPRTSQVVNARAREAVKAPATTLFIAGLVAMCSNLLLAGFGYVDRFVIPLTTESRNRQAFIESVRGNEVSTFAPGRVGSDYGLSEDATVTLTICTLISLSFTSAAAAWAGYAMLRLRSYWLSVAGSFAIMAGGSLCCMGGIPIGIWCLSVLFKPDVAASFR